MSLNHQFPADLVTFTEEILNRELHFLCSSFPRSTEIHALNNPALSSIPLRRKCSNSELFWSVFPHIRTEYGDTPYLFAFSLNAGKTDQNNSKTDTVHAVYYLKKIQVCMKSRGLIKVLLTWKI